MEKSNVAHWQVLAEYKQKTVFNELLARYEEKPVCEGRSLDLFLTYPMHQVQALPYLPHAPGTNFFLTHPMHQVQTSSSSTPCTRYMYRLLLHLAHVLRIGTNFFVT